jgi:hypothetical protein
VAHAAQCLGLTKADLFVQANAAPAKIAKLRQYNVNLHLIGNLFDEAQAAAFEFAKKNGATYVSAYDDLDVIAGQGTVGLEIARLAGRRYHRRAGGGGGLIADSRPSPSHSIPTRHWRESCRLTVGLSLQTRWLSVRDLQERTNAGRVRQAVGKFHSRSA